MVTKKILSYLVAFSLCITMLSTQVFADAENTKREFSDVPAHKPYAKAVYDLAERNIIGGYPDGTFNPGASITRGQAASIIAKLLDLPTKNVKNPGFQDVNENLWSYGAIAATVDRGIFKGYENGRFGPNDPITRGQMASILIKTFGFHSYQYHYQSSPFTDIDKAMSHQNAIMTLHELSITSGTSPTTFSPNQPITRAQAAVLITNTEKTAANKITLKGKDFGWSEFRGYNDYQADKYVPSEQVEPSIIKVIPTRTFSDALQIIPLKTGTQKLVISGANETQNGSESKKFYVHVSNQNGKLVADMEETKDVLTTDVRLRAAKDKVKAISLMSTDGKIIKENVPFKICPENSNLADLTLICISLSEPTENLAVVEYENGKKVNYALSSSAQPNNFYYRTASILVIPKVTVDLTKEQGDFSEFVLRKEDEKIIKVKKDAKANIFQIEGIGEGYAYIDFPKSDRKKDGVLGLYISVKKVANQFQVEVEYYTYEDIFH